MANKKQKTSKKSPRSHEIEAEAIAFFLTNKPSHWIPAELKPDYAKDFHVELKDPVSKDVTDKTFYVQLKGVEKGNYRRTGGYPVHKSLTYLLNILTI